jgi:hypothetical protein
VPQDAADLDSDQLRAGQVRWTTADSPWVHDVDRDVLRRSLEQFGALAPTMGFSSHLPPAPGAMLDVLVDGLAQAPTADPFVGPDHAAFAAMLSGMTPVPA